MSTFRYFIYSLLCIILASTGVLVMLINDHNYCSQLMKCPQGDLICGNPECYFGKKYENSTSLTGCFHNGVCTKDLVHFEVGYIFAALMFLACLASIIIIHKYSVLHTINSYSSYPSDYVIDMVYISSACFFAGYSKIFAVILMWMFTCLFMNISFGVKYYFTNKLNNEVSDKQSLLP